MGACVTVRTYTPQFQIRLIKLVARRDGVAERHAAAARDIDLTPYLGDGGAVRTVKGLADPAGAFSISFADGSRDGFDTLYALAEPMDMVEIRAARAPTNADKLPLIMRGFVSTVHRAESMGANGEPQRTVVISGQDSGKLLQINQIFFEMAWLTDQPFLSQFMLQTTTGMAVKVMRIGEFMESVIKEVANPKVRGLFAVSGKVAKGFRVDASVTDGSLTPGMIAPMNGPVWRLMETYADRPWNELYVEDEEDGPVVRFRPAPYKDLYGKLIMPGAKDPGSVTLTDDDVVTWSASRTDGRVANWYWVPPGSSSLDTNAWLNRQSLREGMQLDLTHPNSREDLYGIKKMEVPSRLVPDIPIPLTAAAPALRPSMGEKYVQWHITRGQQLKAMNRDNSVLEDVMATVKGSEDLRPGRYLRLERGGLTAEGYVTRVTHTIAALRTWTSDITIERGTGFLARAKHTSNPYWDEGRRGPYT